MALVHENTILSSHGERLRQAWAAKGNPYCRHRHFGIESTESEYATGFYICKRCGTRTNYDDIPISKNANDYRTSPVRVGAAFLSGVLIGAAFTVFITPEGGSVVRQRLYRGVRNLRTEMPQLISDSRDAYGALAKDARQTFRQTASRLTAIITTCMEAAKKNITRP